jgi:endonuclease/exonuclease/phosphatase family metal-dependent hydrolase
MKFLMTKKRFLFHCFHLLVLLLVGCRVQATPEKTAPPATSPISDIQFLQKDSPVHIRVMSFNVGWDSIFLDDDPQNDPWREYSKGPEFVRILQAVKPDILCLQEINPLRDPGQVGDILDRALPLEGGAVWQVHSGSDNLIGARFSMSMESSKVVIGSPLPGWGHAMALVDLPEEMTEKDLYLICAHFKSQGGQANIDARQAHADSISAWIRDLRTPGGEIDLLAGTPLIVLGDLNVYDTDPAYHLTTLLSGDIVDESKYGNDFPPDWDGTDLEDALPHHNAMGLETYTWRDDTQEFNPGVLDHILYSDSVIQIENGFVLNTMTLTQEALKRAGLQAGDVLLAPERGIFDHLPLVVDISFIK